MTELPPLPIRERRDTILSGLERGSMVLPAAPRRLRSGDSEYRYRPDSELLYVTGWQTPDCVALLRGFADRERFTLFVSQRDAKAELWTGPRPDLEEVREHFGADAAHPLHKLAERGGRLLAAGDTIHYRMGASEGCDGVVREALRRGRARRGRTGAGAHVVADPGAILDAMRVRKDAAEIARMREAARITVAAFRDTLPGTLPGTGEWEVEAALESGFRRRGATGAAFPTMVAAGANACTLHYSANASRIGPDDLVLVDAGAEVDWYAADITRTVPASRRLDGARREAHEIVRRAHRAAVAACGPGGSLTEVHGEASRVIAEGLVGMGVVAGPAEKVIAEKRHRAFYPHQTSHWLGLDTHDPGPYRDQHGPMKLQPGMVFTVEPGLYFPRGGCPRRPELEGTGIRIEDDVLITAQGAEVLTAGLPTGIDELAGLE